MKTSKKILSIVLAVMLLVGTVVVGASAETMVFEKAGSKLVYTATASKAANAEGFIEVEPGETITVSVYAQANYYFSTTGSEAFGWTPGFFETITNANVETFNFVNNYTPNKKVVASSGAAQLGYAKGEREGYVYGRTYSTDCTSPFDASEPTLGYTFTLTVLETAAPGTTAEFCMPEACSATVATTSRMRSIYAAVNNSDTDYYSGTVASIYPETIDLTGTVLNFKVASAEAPEVPEVPCDYTALEEALNLEPDYDEEFYVEDTWDAYMEALEAADAIDRDMMVDAEGKNQAMIDAAAEALTDAFNALKVKQFVDLSALEAALALTPEYDEEYYDKDTWAAWETAVSEGRDSYESLEGEFDDDWARDEAAAAAQAITDAFAALELKAADYSDVDAAIEEAAQVDRSKYTAASLKKLDDAIAAVVTGLNITQQSVVRDMAKAIRDAIAALVPLGECDYTDLDAAIIAAQAYVTNKSNYTPASWEASGIDSAYSAAFFIATGDKLIADEAGVNQAKIDAAAKALTDAFNALVPVADKTALAAAIARATALNEDDYTPESWEAADLESALIAANRVYEDADAPQTIVDGMVSAIERAEDKLVKKADKSALKAAIEAAKDLDEADYTPESWAAADLEAVIAAAETVYDDANATDAEVADAIAALEAAAAKLAEKADKAALKAAIDTLPEVAEDEATSETWAAYEEELAKANRVYADANATQDDVDAAEANLLAAIAGVKALDPCDYTALDAAIATTPEYSAEYYDAEEYAAYEAALAAAKAVERDMLDDEAGVNQKAIDDATAALTAAYAELDVRFVDITALENAERDYHNPGFEEEWLDPVEYAAWEAALEAVHQARSTYANAPDTAENREAVAKLAADLKAAYEELDPRAVDTTALEAALALTPAYGAEYYDAAAYRAWQDAVAAGETVYDEVRDGTAPDTEANRKAVADAADAINATFAKLVPQFIDYSALEEAVTKYGSTPEASDAYTAESYAAYEEALAAANDILANKDENAPASDAELAAEIAAAAKALTDAYNGLELADKSIVLKVTPKVTNFNVGDTVEFEFLCSTTNVSKIQIVREGGSTSTYTRTHTKVTSIVNNGDGTETWTILLSITSENFYLTAKGKLGKVWETGGYKFKVSTAKAEDIEVKSAAAIPVTGDTLLANKEYKIVIVTGANTLRIRLVTPGGSTSTYTRTSAVQLDDGTWQWTITRKSNAGDFFYNIYTAGANNKLVDEGTDLIYKVVTAASLAGPSTGNKADIVVSAVTEKARLLVGDVQTVTIVTDKKALGVRLVNENGTALVNNKDLATAIDNGDGTLTWSVRLAASHAGTVTYGVQALYGNQWQSNGTEISYKIVY